MEDLYKDIFDDAKHQRKFYGKIIVTLVIIIAVLIGGMVFMSVHNQNLLKEMASECNDKIADILADADFVTEYELMTDNGSFNNGSITVNR